MEGLTFTEKIITTLIVGLMLFVIISLMIVTYESFVELDKEKAKEEKILQMLNDSRDIKLDFERVQERVNLDGRI